MDTPDPDRLSLAKGYLAVLQKAVEDLQKKDRSTREGVKLLVAYMDYSVASIRSQIEAIQGVLDTVKVSLDESGG